MFYYLKLLPFENTTVRGRHEFLFTETGDQWLKNLNKIFIWVLKENSFGLNVAKQREMV